MSRRVLLDEHVSRVLERVLRDRGYEVAQAKDRLGERTSDRQLLRYCERNGVLLVSNNAKDFESLHRDQDHPGLLLYYDQDLPDDDPEGLARAVDEVVEQYGTGELRNALVDLDTWYEWLQE